MQAIESTLEGLGPEWVVIRTVPVGEHGRVVDHLAIGPAGVFALAAVAGRRHDVTLDGEHLVVDGVAQSCFEAARDLASDAAIDLTKAAGFNVPARALLVFDGPHALIARDEPYDVGVTTDRALHARLADAPRVLDAAEIAAIADAAADVAAWRGAIRRLRVPDEAAATAPTALGVGGDRDDRVAGRLSRAAARLHGDRDLVARLQAAGEFLRGRRGVRAV